MPDQRTSGTGPTGPEWNQNFQQCLELLRGPGDERRFVGLLLVTRLLPQGSDDAVRRVLDALGTQFLHRLLLPLRRTPQQVSEPAAPEASQQQATSCGLALAILAAACRLPEFAAGPDLRDMVPLLLRVVQYGGVAPLLHTGAAAPGGSGGTGGSGTTTDDAAAVSDALECLVAAAAAAPAETCSALEQSFVMDALAAWLTAAAAALTSVPPRGRDGDAPDVTAAAAEAQQHSGMLMAAALLERLLAGDSGAPPSARTVAVLAAHPAAAARIIAALAAFMGNPRLLLLPPPPAAPSSAATPQQQPTMDNEPNQYDSEPNQYGQGRSTSAGGSSSGAGAGGRGRGDAPGGPAQLQLEALHVLLLLLRACEEPAAAAAAEELVRLDEKVAWSAAVRRGLGWMLRSRVPGPLKHAALQLAALVVGLAGEGWLLGRGAAGAAGAGGTGLRQSGAAAPPLAAAERPEAFLQLLTETLKIETGLLLQDALHPDRRVPAGEAARGSLLGHRAPPQPSQRLLDELAARAAQNKAAVEAAAEAAARAAAAAAGGSEAAPAELQAQAEPQPSQQLLLGQDGAEDGGAAVGAAVAAATAMDADGAAAAGAKAQAVGSGELHVLKPTAAAAEGGGGHVEVVPTMPAGERALALLPACFRLLEACVEAVATDAAAADGDMEVDVAAGSAAAVAVPPVLPDAALRSLMAAFDSTSETLLQFFEAAAEQQQQPQELQPTAAPVSQGLLLGAARVLGRYFAEAPGAVRSGSVLGALPLVMAVRGGSAAAAGRFAGNEFDEYDDEDESFALPFLLPALLQATGVGADDRSETAKALRDSAVAVDACVSYLAHCVGCAATAAPHVERLLAAAGAAAASGGGAAGAAGAAVRGSATHAALVRSEQGMADVSMLLLNLLEPGALAGLTVAKPGAAAGAATAAAAAAGADGGGAGNHATPASPAWGMLCRWHVSAGGAGSAGSGAEVEAASAAAMQHLPPLLARLQPVCWLVRRWAAAREATLQAVSSLDPLSHPGGAAAHLSRSQLGTRALLSPSCLASVILVATMRCLVNASNDQGPARGAAVCAILPPALVEGICAAALTAAAAGTSLEYQQLRAALEAQEQGSGGEGGDMTMEEARPGGDGNGGEGLEAGAPWLTPAGALADFPGDGEVCWERLLGSCVQLVEMSDEMRRLVRGAAWLRRLAAAAANAGGAVRVDAAGRELLLEVNLALLLQLVGSMA